MSRENWTEPRWNEASPFYAFAKGVVERLRSKGYIAYFAGGCVRDAFLGNPPSDYDVATDARIEQVIDLFGPKQTLGIGTAFGVACVHQRIDGIRHQVEVATFRSDGSYSDGRRPDWVTFSSPQEDAQRRDFTINGMFYDPIERQLKDYVGGEEDLRLGRIRAIGVPDDRIDEDKLRMLRAVRFIAKFGFEIEEETANAIRRHAAEVATVSGERIAAEMRKLFETPRPVSGLLTMYAFQLLHVLWPELANHWDADSEVRERGIRYMTSLPVGSHFSSYVAAPLFPCVAGSEEGIKNALCSLQEGWKLSNEETQFAEVALKDAKILCQADREAWSVLQPILLKKGIESALEVAAAIVEGDGIGRAGLERCEEALRLPRAELDPTPLITGEDLKRLGLSPGPQFADLLHQVRSRQLDGLLRTQAEAIAWVLKLRCS